MSTEEIPSENNTIESHETNEVTPSSTIEKNENEVAGETIEKINEEMASTPDSIIEVSNIESSLSLSDPSKSIEIKNELDLENSLKNLDAEAVSAQQAAILDIESILGEPSPSTEGEISKETTPTLNIFDTTPELAAIGTKEQYQAYLESRFPKEASAKLGEGYIQTSLNSFLENPEDQEGVEKVEKNFIEHYVTMVSDEEFDKTKPYKTSEYLTMNQLLREGKEVTLENILKYKGMDPDQPQYILDDLNTIAEGSTSLQESIKKSYWSANSAVFNDNKTYRVDFTNQLAERNIGDVIEDKAFISTSIDKNQYAAPNLKSDKNSTIMIMNFPKNSIVNALYLAGTEKELVLPPNMSYEIKNKKTLEVNGAVKTVLEIEFLPNEHIHVLGGEKDIEGFKDYIGKKETSTSETLSNPIPSQP